MWMTRQFARWMVACLVSALLLAPVTSSARPTAVTNLPRTKTVRGELDRASKAYDKAQLRLVQKQTLVKRQLARFKSTGNVKQQQWAQANHVDALRARVQMMRAQARQAKAKAKLALKSGNASEANVLTDQAEQLSKRAAKLSAKLDQHEAQVNAAKSAGSPAASPTAEATPVADGPTAQANDTEKAPGVDGPTGLAGLASGRGKKTAKLQMQAGNISGAMETLARMEQQANRGGVMGMVDRFRKWSTKRGIEKNAYKMGKKAARSGDIEMAAQAAGAVQQLNKPGRRTNGKLNSIATEAIKGASKASRSHRPEEAGALLSLARDIQKAAGRAKPTLRFRFVRWRAKNNLMKDLEMRANQGNFEAFRSAMRLASAYAQEDGRHLSKGDLGKIRKLYITAMKNSVVRALDDAHALLTGKMGYNPDEAASRFLYAMDTQNTLAKRGIEVKTGLFHRSLASKFDRVRALLVKANTQEGEAKRPGLARRVFEKLFVQQQNRTNAGPAPVDSRWIARQQAEMQRQQAEMQMMAGAGN
jgi:hypothetical protein